MNIVESTDSELSILETLYLSQQGGEQVRQRKLAQRSQLSLGRTNALLKNLIEKGWISAHRINTRNIRYAVTSDGLGEIMRRSVSTFRRTIGNVEFYKERVEQLVSERRRAGWTGVILLGPSDLEFLVEYACQKNELPFITSADPSFRSRKPLTGRYLYLIAESQEPGSQGDIPLEDLVYLAELFARAP